MILDVVAALPRQMAPNSGHEPNLSTILILHTTFLKILRGRDPNIVIIPGIQSQNGGIKDSCCSLLHARMVLGSGGKPNLSAKE